MTPPLSPTKLSRSGSKLAQDACPPAHESLALLRRDVDFVPLSPKKVQVSQLGVGKRLERRLTPVKLFTGVDLRRQRSALGNALGRTNSEETLSGEDGLDERSSAPEGKRRVMRTTEEKKEILGQLLGNVDALVEGVKKAGIWGLGD